MDPSCCKILTMGCLLHMHCPLQEGQILSNLAKFCWSTVFRTTQKVYFVSLMFFSLNDSLLVCL